LDFGGNHDSFVDSGALLLGRNFCPKSGTINFSPQSYICWAPRWKHRTGIDGVGNGEVFSPQPTRGLDFIAVSAVDLV